VKFFGVLRLRAAPFAQDDGNYNGNYNGKSNGNGNGKNAGVLRSAQDDRFDSKGGGKL
jgi:hypothetical protein